MNKFKLICLLLCFLLFRTITDAQTSSDIKNDGDNNEYNISQMGSNSAVNHIDSKGTRNRYGVEQYSTDTTKVNKVEREKSIQDYANDTNAIIGVGISLLTVAGLWFGLKGKKGIKPKNIE